MKNLILTAIFAVLLTIGFALNVSAQIGAEKCINNPTVRFTVQVEKLDTTGNLSYYFARNVNVLLYNATKDVYQPHGQTNGTTAQGTLDFKCLNYTDTYVAEVDTGDPLQQLDAPFVRYPRAGDNPTLIFTLNQQASFFTMTINTVEDSPYLTNDSIGLKIWGREPNKTFYKTAAFVNVKARNTKTNAFVNAVTDQFGNVTISGLNPLYIYEVCVNDIAFVNAPCQLITPANGDGSVFTYNLYGDLY